jgi:hypothetical protein
LFVPCLLDRNCLTTSHSLVVDEPSVPMTVPIPPGFQDQAAGSR